MKKEWALPNPPLTSGGSKFMTTPNKRLLGIIIGVCALLTVPFFAMKLGVEGVDWKVFDFIAAGIMLFGAGFAIEIALRRYGIPIS